MKLKKILALSLATLMVFSFAACGSNNNENSSQSSEVENVTPTPEPTPAGPVVVAPTVDDNTLGSLLWNAFLDEITKNPNTTTEEMANLLVTNENIKFMGGAMPIAPAADGAEAYFAGFDNYQISGFESGAMYMPMIGSIPFVGYVFTLPQDADVNAFMKGLSENCNPRWNICVTADQTVIGSVDNTVFFLMCPTTLPTE